MASVLAQYFRTPLDALYAASTGAWEGRAERVKRLIAEHTAREQLAVLTAPFTGTLEVHSCVRRGAPADVILAHAEESQASLIVLGAADRRRFGSPAHRLATTVASAASAAVLTVPSDTRACAVRRILVPITTSEAARPATNWAMSLARRFGASVSLVCMAPQANWFVSPLFGRDRRAQDMARRRTALLERARERFHQAEIAATEESPQRDATDLALLARDGAFDLVVLGLPSTAELDAEQLALTERLRQCSRVPTLSVRARVQQSSQAKRRSSPEEWGVWQPDSAA